MKINERKLNTRIIEAGVPQGSILGPAIYNTYTADIPRIIYSKIAQYADDTVIYTSRRIKSLSPLTRKI